MKKFLLIVGILILLAIVCAFIFLKGKRHEITITPAQIDAKLAETFPVEKTYFLLFHFNFANPDVVFLPDSNRVQVGLNATLDLRIPGNVKSRGGKFITSFGIRYDSDEKAVYLTDPVVEKIEIEDVPEKYLEKVSLAATKAAGELFLTLPVYQLKGTDAKSTAAKVLLKDIQVTEQKIVLSLGI